MWVAQVGGASFKWSKNVCTHGKDPSFTINIVDLQTSLTDTYTLFSSEQFYKNNEAQICPKIRNKLRINN